MEAHAQDTKRTHLGRIFPICFSSQIEEMRWWLFVPIIVVLMFVVYMLCKRMFLPSLFIEIKRRYEILLDHLRTAPGIDERFEPIKKHRPLFTGIDSSRMNKGTIGYNVNKGYEIFICVDTQGSVDAAMHILIHELAHMTVPEYDHSEAFWKNFRDLRQLCIHLGILQNAEQSMMYCGGQIKI